MDRLSRVALLSLIAGWSGCSDSEPSLSSSSGGTSSSGGSSGGTTSSSGGSSSGGTNNDAGTSGGLVDGDTSTPTTTTSFTETDLDMPNPERGFFSFSGELSGARASTFTDLYESGQRIAYASAKLSAFRGSAISNAYLEGLTTGFASARGAGMKVVLRFVYDNTEAGNDAPLSIVRQHLTQLKPILAANADVIAVLQGGFIGAWGEWHSSSNDLTTAANRLAVRDALLDALPSGVFLNLRYPPDLMGWYPNVLDAAGAFQPTAQARIGVHNDCFLASPTDVGTYSSNPTTQATQRAYVKALAAFTPFGGETCEGDAPRRTSCNDILTEGRDYHVAYLNRTYDTSFHDTWIDEGCFDEVSRSLGYRLRLESMRHSSRGARGAASTFEVQLRNVGWARLFSARKLTVVLRHAVTGASIVGHSESDVRATLAAGGEGTLSIPLTIPAEAETGDYEVHLALPDVSLADDPRFAVRFANADDAAKDQRWDATTARFHTGATLTVE